MSANFVDIFTAQSSAKDRPTLEGASFKTERRARTRTQVHWPVLLLRDCGGKAIDTVTQNLSSSGFYCLSSTGLAPGERLFCTLRVPAHDPNNDGTAVSLECYAVVMRSEVTAAGEFGVAFRIEDYHLGRIKS
jgi:hypothetical protein